MVLENSIMLTEIFMKETGLLIQLMALENTFIMFFYFIQNGAVYEGEWYNDK
jgi:hypothetical protein